MPRLMVSAPPTKAISTAERICKELSAAAVRKAGEPATIDRINIKGTISPAANCNNNRMPTLRPTLFADIITSSVESKLKGYWKVLRKGDEKVPAQFVT